MTHQQALEFIQIFKMDFQDVTLKQDSGGWSVFNSGALDETFHEESWAALWYLSRLNQELESLRKPGVSTSKFIAYDLAFQIRDSLLLKNFTYYHSRGSSQSKAKVEEIIAHSDDINDFIRLTVFSTSTEVTIDMSIYSKNLIVQLSAGNEPFQRKPLPTKGLKFGLDGFSGLDGFRNKQEFLTLFNDCHRFQIWFAGYLQDVKSTFFN
jgi:hypothetical protein